jgi:hypothetical protein
MNYRNLLLIVYGIFWIWIGIACKAQIRCRTLAGLHICASGCRHIYLKSLSSLFLKGFFVFDTFLLFVRVGGCARNTAGRVYLFKKPFMKLKGFFVFDTFLLFVRVGSCARNAAYLCQVNFK